MPIQTAIDSISNSQGSPFGFKNRIINGGMVIDQRNAGASVTPTSSAYTLDRWYFDCSQSSKASVQRNAGSVTPPAGFTNYIGVTSASAYTVGADDYFWLSQFIEGYNIADLAWGSSDAQTVTLSFWVRSSLTGTFGGALQNSSSDRSYPFSYTISQANTWEKETITIRGDTTGTWLTTNGKGIRLSLGLGVGSNRSGTAGAWAATNYASSTSAVSVVGTNAATFYVTGVQLEKGTQATSFDYRDYGNELRMCQRYCYVLNTTNYASYTRLGVASGANSTVARLSFPFPVTMRATPSLTSSGTSRMEAGSALNVTAINASGISAFSFGADVSVASGLTTGSAYSFDIGTSGSLIMNSEL